MLWKSKKIPDETPEDTREEEMRRRRVKYEEGESRRGEDEMYNQEELELIEIERRYESRRREVASLCERQARAEEALWIKRREIDLARAQLEKKRPTMSPEVSDDDDEDFEEKANEIAGLCRRVAILEAVYSAKKQMLTQAKTQLEEGSLAAVITAEAERFRATLRKARLEYRESRPKPVSKIYPSKQKLSNKPRAPDTYIVKKRKEIVAAHLVKTTTNELNTLKKEARAAKLKKKEAKRRAARTAQLDQEFKAMLAQQQKEESDAEKTDINSQRDEHLTEASRPCRARFCIVAKDQDTDMIGLADWIDTARSVVGVKQLEGLAPIRLVSKHVNDRRLELEFKIDSQQVDKALGGMRLACGPYAKQVDLLNIEPCDDDRAPPQEAITSINRKFGIVLTGRHQKTKKTVVQEAIQAILDDTSQSELQQLSWNDYADLDPISGLAVVQAAIPDSMSTEKIVTLLSQLLVKQLALATLVCYVDDKTFDSSAYQRITLRDDGNNDHAFMGLLDTTTVLEKADDNRPIQDTDNAFPLSQQETPVASALNEKKVVATPADRIRAKALSFSLPEPIRTQSITSTNFETTALKNQEPLQLKTPLSRGIGSTRSILSSEASAPDTAKFNIKFGPDQEPEIVAAAVVALDLPGVAWDLEDFTYVPHPQFPYLIVTAGLVDAEKEEVYRDLCKELIENPKHLLVTFVDYLYDWDRPDQSETRLLDRCAIQSAVDRLQVSEDQDDDEAALGVDEDILEEEMPPDEMFAADNVFEQEEDVIGTEHDVERDEVTNRPRLDRELAFLGLSHCVEHLHAVGIVDSESLAEASVQKITTAAEAAGLAEPELAKLNALAKESRPPAFENTSDESSLRRKFETAPPRETIHKSSSVRKRFALGEGDNSLQEVGSERRTSSPTVTFAESALKQSRQGENETLFVNQSPAHSEPQAPGEPNEARDISSVDVYPLEVGARVTVNWRGLNRFYDGCITNCREDGTYDIMYDDGENEESVAKSNIKVQVNQQTPEETTSLGTSLPSRTSLTPSEKASDEGLLAKGDRVYVNYKRFNVFYSGCISTVHENGTYDVNYDDGDLEFGVERTQILTPFSVGDRVTENSVGGVVLAIRPDGIDYTVRFDDGREANVARERLELGESQAKNAAGEFNQEDDGVPQFEMPIKEQIPWGNEERDDKAINLQDDADNMESSFWPDRDSMQYEQQKNDELSNTHPQDFTAEEASHAHKLESQFDVASLSEHDEPKTPAATNTEVTAADGEKGISEDDRTPIAATDERLDQDAPNDLQEEAGLVEQAEEPLVEETEVKDDEQEIDDNGNASVVQGASSLDDCLRLDPIDNSDQREGPLTEGATDGDDAAPMAQMSPRLSDAVTDNMQQAENDEANSFLFDGDYVHTGKDDDHDGEVVPPNDDDDDDETGIFTELPEDENLYVED